MRTIFANLLIREKALKMLLEDGLLAKFLSFNQSKHIYIAPKVTSKMTGI